MLNQLLVFARTAGFDPAATVAWCRGLPRYLRDARRYRARQQEAGGRFSFSWRNAKPFLTDFESEAGVAGGHYFFQDLWAARLVFARRPARHLDIASRVDGFVAHLLTFMPVEVIDVRPLASSVPGLTFVQGDATDLRGFADNSVESLSCLHAIEHFGLGRYGDPIDPGSCFKAIRSMTRVLKPGGRLYLSTPVGVERLEFNAQRVFSPRTIIETCATLELVSFSTVRDDGRFVERVSPDSVSDQRYACGMFEFTKP